MKASDMAKKLKEAMAARTLSLRMLKAIDVDGVSPELLMHAAIQLAVECAVSTRMPKEAFYQWVEDFWTALDCKQ